MLKPLWSPSRPCHPTDRNGRHSVVAGLLTAPLAMTEGLQTRPPLWKFPMIFNTQVQTNEIG
jgi:hypothetical protein